MTFIIFSQYAHNSYTVNILVTHNFRHERIGKRKFKIYISVRVLSISHLMVCVIFFTALIICRYFHSMLIKLGSITKLILVL